MDTNYQNSSPLTPLILAAEKLEAGTHEFSLTAGDSHDVKFSLVVEKLENDQLVFSEILMQVFGDVSPAPMSAIRLGGAGQVLTAEALDKGRGMVNAGTKQMILYRCKVFGN